MLAECLLIDPEDADGADMAARLAEQRMGQGRRQRPAKRLVSTES